MWQVWGTGVKLEMLLRTMGLARVADTMVGNALLRGVSGGERKRVTSAEMLVGPKVGNLLIKHLLHFPFTLCIAAFSGLPAHLTTSQCCSVALE